MPDSAPMLSEAPSAFSAFSHRRAHAEDIASLNSNRIPASAPSVGGKSSSLLPQTSPILQQHSHSLPHLRVRQHS